MRGMHIYRRIGILCTLVLALLVGPAQARPVARDPLRIDPQAAQWLAQAAPEDTTTFLVGLYDDGTQALADQAVTISDKPARRARVYQLLSTRAGRNADAVRAVVQAGGRASEVRALTAFQTFNGFAITTNHRVVELLRRWERVSSVALDVTVQLEQTRIVAPLAQISATEWNITRVGANRVWTELGINGSGAVVGGIDTGVRFTHEALNANYRCLGGAHTNCWHDAVNNFPLPYDNEGHGTHTMGTAVGQNGIGVAPGARWIACKAFAFNPATGQTVGYGSDVLECFDWFLAPNDNPVNAPDVVNNSWGASVGTISAFQQAVDNWVNAGIYPVFSNGNDGPGCGTVGAPASYSNTLGTGATDINDMIASFSSRGPSPFGVMKPDVVAPGVNIRSAWYAGDASYAAMSGTSMAAPHVSGLVALVLQANSGLSISQITARIKNYALGMITNACSSSGVPNNVYGRGRISAFESVFSILMELPPTADYDGDGRKELGVWRPSNGHWNLLNSSNGQQRSVPWGSPGDITVPGDYDGDLKTDIAVWRPSDHNWYILNSSNGQQRIVFWGDPGDIAVPRDYDGNRKTDIAVWRPSDHNWYILNSSTLQMRIVAWGDPGDIAVPGDYDGDRKADIAVWRPSDHNWYILNSATLQTRIMAWGDPGDIAVPGDYDGDRKTDIAVWRPSNGNWYILSSVTGQQRIVLWGDPNDIAMPGDYDGDYRTDIAVWRPSDGNWYILNSSTGQQRVQQWGVPGDHPL